MNHISYITQSNMNFESMNVKNLREYVKNNGIIIPGDITRIRKANLVEKIKQYIEDFRPDLGENRLEGPAKWIKTYRNNPEKRFNEQRSKFLARIKKGVVPKPKTLLKYNVTDEELKELGITLEKKEEVPENTGIMSFDSMLNYIRAKETLSDKSKNNYITSVTTIFMTYGQCDPNDISDCLRKIDKILLKIFNDYTNHNTRLMHLRSLNAVLDNKDYKGLISKKSRKWLDDQYTKLKTKSQATRIQNMSKRVEDWDTILEKVRNRYPDLASSERLFIELFDQATVRDDFGSLIVIDRVSEAVDNNKNYITKQPNPVIILNKYKTASKYGQKRIKLGSPIYKIMQGLKKQSGDYLFTSQTGEGYVGGRLSNLVDKMLNKAGVIRDDKDGVINLLRKSKLTKLLKNAKTVEERMEIAEQAGHMPLTGITYTRETY